MAASEVATYLLTYLLIFFRETVTSEAEISVSGKTECLLAIGKDKTSKPFGVPSPIGENPIGVNRFISVFSGQEPATRKNLGIYSLFGFS